MSDQEYYQQLLDIFDFADELADGEFGGKCVPEEIWEETRRRAEKT